MKALDVTILVVAIVVATHLAIELLGWLILLEPDTREAGMRNSMGILVGLCGGQWMARKVTARLRQR